MFRSTHNKTSYCSPSPLDRVPEEPFVPSTIRVVLPTLCRTAKMKSRCTNAMPTSFSVRHVTTLLGVLACCLLFPARGVEAFLTQPARRGITQSFTGRLQQRFAESETSTASVQGSASGSATDDDNNNPCHLPAELKKIADAFERIGDDKLRYKQLLFMANQAKPMDAASQIPENQVPGCLSTVFVDGTAEKDHDDSEDYRIHFVGDSDGLLTKGLVALLVRGLSGSTADEIQKVDPVFIQKCGISTSLTPGRNNGFLNMLAVMKKKAFELEAAAKEAKNSESSPASTGAGDDSDISGAAAAVGGDGEKPMYTAIRTALQQLQPVSMDLKDVSYQHAGHVEGGDGEESHFELEIVADAFDGLNLVKRHQLIYMMLGEVMPQIHALQIRANTPAEVQK